MFDYIVIGAGTAGCVLAARLSEDPAVQVLLMEAGPPDRARAIRVPLAFPSLFQTPIDWDYWTQPQTRLASRHLYWPRGKTLGGSGSINAMVHTYPCAADFADWAVPGWDAASILPLCENVLRAGMVANPVGQLNPLSTAFLDSCASVGLPRAQVLEDAAKPMAAPFRLNIKDGKRWSAADAYLRPALQRGNLTVWTSVQARRIVSENGRVTGVEFEQDGSAQTVAVTREVVLCAGTIGSPQLLLLSGIGPQKDLEALKIPMTAAIEGVGHNLQDHLAAPLSYFSLEPVSYSGAMTFKNEWMHRLSGTGPLASNGAEAGAVIKTKTAQGACDVEIVFAAGHYVDHGFASPGGHGFSLIPVLLTPKSRGKVRLQSADPAEDPAIDPSYVAEAADIQVLSEGIRFARRLVEQPELARYRGAPVPGRVMEPEEHIAEWGQSLYHPVGTCKLGSDEAAVVGPDLRVHGVTGLRVADASVMPTVPRAHINATVLLIAERAAQLLRG